ncbi:hypothetical protein HIM_03080 [Hirsutella minnesotensis 3608]|nr:hypothetical protein HIM_03080 [Hirsutella minnesotensis 3608]
MATRRDHQEYRAALVVDDFDDALKSLYSISEGSSAPPTTKWTIQSRVMVQEMHQGIVFVFSGHGAQWADMGKRLLHNHVFLEAVEPLDAVVQREINTSPIELFRAGDVSSSDMVQILTYILQIGITQVLQSHGIYPHAIIGHSVGEIAAAVVAGALTPEEGVVIVTRRSVLYRAMMGKGAMVTMNMSFEEVAKLVNAQEDPDLAVAVHSSPSSCVISGPVEAVSKAVASWKQHHHQSHINALNVKTDIAFHSPMLAGLAQPLFSALEGSLNPCRTGKCKIYSTSSMDPRYDGYRDAQYWVNNMISPVRLTQAVQAAVQDSYRVFVEISSHPIVSHAISEVMLDLSVNSWSVIPTLLRESDADKCILGTLARLHCVGIYVDWAKLMPYSSTSGLPNTPLVHQPIWRKVETGNVNRSPLYTVSHDTQKHTLLGKRTKVIGADLVLYTTLINSTCKPSPGGHPVLGTEVVPAAVLLNTFLAASGALCLKDVGLRAVVAIIGNASRAVQVSLRLNEAVIASQLVPEQGVDEVGQDASWTTHATAKCISSQLQPHATRLDISSIQRLTETRLANSFSIDHLSGVGVATMAFPWVVKEHYRGENVMLARVDAMPGVEDTAELPWDESSWAPLMDPATSVASTIFNIPRLRLPTHVQRIDVLTAVPPPKTFWLYIELVFEADFACDISIVDLEGNPLFKFTQMRFSEIEGQAATIEGGHGMDTLVHGIEWRPAAMLPHARPIPGTVLISENAELRDSWATACVELLNTTPVLLSSSQGLETAMLPKDGAIVYMPAPAASHDDIYRVSKDCTWQLLEIIKFVFRHRLSLKVFAIVSNALNGDTSTALEHSPLVGLCRVLASEHPEEFGCLIDGENHNSETIATSISIMRRIQNADVVCIRNGLPTVARLQALPVSKKLDPPISSSRLTPRPGGTYLITGGLGALGLEVTAFLVDKGARRLVLVSRRRLPDRSQWDTVRRDDWPHAVLARIQALEDLGASIYVIAVDVGTSTAARELQVELDKLSLPPIAGVIHAAGVAEDQMALRTTKDAFARVLAPKIQGSLALHQLFPPGSVDFFVLFSSCGQLVGFTGQSSYASANAFLDSLAAHRRAVDDDTVSFLWTSWRGMGMVANSERIALELENKGITDVTRDDAFAAWLHLAKYDVGHGVILRTLEQTDREPLPILSDISRRRLRQNGEEGNTLAGDSPWPDSPDDIEAFLTGAIQCCVAKVLHAMPTNVEPGSSLSDMGIDSVMGVMLRRLLQQTLKIKVPPTLIWNCPTVKHMVTWFSDKVHSSR